MKYSIHDDMKVCHMLIKTNVKCSTAACGAVLSVIQLIKGWAFRWSSSLVCCFMGYVGSSCAQN